MNSKHSTNYRESQLYIIFFTANLLDAFFSLMTYDRTTESIEIYSPDVGAGLTKPMKRSPVWKYFTREAESKRAT